VQINRDFLYYLQPSGIKSAYRKKAKETHPDCFVDAKPEEHERLSELFRGVSQAYKLLDTFSSDNNKKMWSPADWRTDYRARSTHHSAHGYGAGCAGEQQEQSPFTLPQRYLEAGLYLYYRGVISYAEMIEALVWQRRQRPIIGNIAETWGWLKNADVQAINRHHGRRGRFGARAVDLGYLTPFQVQVLLRHQRQSQKLFGQYFVEQGRLTNAEVEAYIRAQRQHNAHYRNTTI
jgi:hypothetical protein